MPKVSIVLPTYNGQDFISESIESIIRQTYTDWELIIVNDCSTDDTQQIIDKYILMDKRIRTIKNCVNKKLPESLNIGFRNANGELLTWTSDDNIDLPEALSEMVKFLDNNPDSYMVCAAMQVIDEKGNFIRKYLKYDPKTMLHDDCVGACFMYRSCVLSDVGEYDAGRFLVEDYDYWLRILFNYGKIDYIDKELYLYREHGKSLTGKRKKEIYNQWLRLRKDNISNIIDRLSGDKREICRIYYEFKTEGLVDKNLREKFVNVFPEIRSELEIDGDKKIVVYGAGGFGQKAYEGYGDRIAYYVDRNQNLVGERLNGVEIVSTDKLPQLQEDYLIVIAAHPINIYSFIEILQQYKIKKYGVFVQSAK